MVLYEECSDRGVRGFSADPFKSVVEFVFPMDRIQIFGQVPRSRVRLYAFFGEVPYPHGDSARYHCYASLQLFSPLSGCLVSEGRCGGNSDRPPWALALRTLWALASPLTLSLYLNLCCLTFFERRCCAAAFFCSAVMGFLPPVICFTGSLQPPHTKSGA